MSDLPNPSSFVSFLKTSTDLRRILIKLTSLSSGEPCIIKQEQDSFHSITDLFNSRWCQDCRCVSNRIHWSSWICEGCGRRHKIQEIQSLIGIVPERIGGTGQGFSIENGKAGFDRALGISREPQPKEWKDKLKSYTYTTNSNAGRLDHLIAGNQLIEDSDYLFSTERLMSSDIAYERIKTTEGISNFFTICLRTSDCEEDWKNSPTPFKSFVISESNSSAEHLLSVLDLIEEKSQRFGDEQEFNELNCCISFNHTIGYSSRPEAHTGSIRAIYQ